LIKKKVKMKDFESGNSINQGTYKSFQPNNINRPWQIVDMELVLLLSQADTQLGRLDMYSEYIPNIDLFISMHVFKEAIKSSKIEGTQTTIEEALLDKDEIAEEKRDDWEEVQNYIRALNIAVKRLKDIPFATRLIKESHRVLMEGVRGEHKQPGEYRSSQNWIGGSNINNAVFVPPLHTSINDLMSDLEKFAHNTNIKLPHLLRIALIHYQFETIHPFLDGNGRVGRLLITLYLVEKEVLKKPILYLSDFFERNRGQYYDNLTNVRASNDLGSWFKYFLTGIIESSKSGIETFDNILKLKEESDAKIVTLKNRSSSALKIMEHFYQRPILTANKCSQLTGLSLPTVYKLIADLEGLDILQELTGGKRGKIFIFKSYMDLFR